MHNIDIIDLHFQDHDYVIGSYVLRGPDGAALIETGPASCVDNLWAGLRERGIEPRDIRAVLVTHIHLDHSGAAGWVARETGAAVYVHQVGAPHLADPSRLLRSAARIYGDLMDRLWGETIPVPREQIRVVEDNDVVEAAGLRIRALDTPGHAYHHLAYVLDGLCFTGDVVGMQSPPGCAHVRLPTPPPEINIPLWRQSLARLREIRPDGLLLTHFGPAEEDALTHIERAEAQLEAYLQFVEPRWRAGQSDDEICPDFLAWLTEQTRADGCGPEVDELYHSMGPDCMHVAGLTRYLRKREEKAASR